jgi:hypothetical protein
MRKPPAYRPTNDASAGARCIVTQPQLMMKNRNITPRAGVLLTTWPTPGNRTAIKDTQ